MNIKHQQQSRFQGMWQVVRFNPAFYLTVIPLLGISAFVLATIRLPFYPLQLAGWLGWSLALWWVVASLLVSHWVYDLSSWSKGTWLKKALANNHKHTPAMVINVHAGFDETTLRLRQWLPTSQIIPLDLFDPTLLTEKSIHRARAYLPPQPDTLAGPFNNWPSTLNQLKADTVMFLLTAHEFRQHKERVELLRQARLQITAHPHGCIIIAEHVRDLANFIAFGPGFMHFHSVHTWKHALQEAGLNVTHAFKVTPFVRVWRLKA